MKNILTNSKVFISLMILYPLLFIWQGLDFTDSGYLMTNFQQFFNDPASIGGSMVIWLTNLIGGVWVCLFGDLLGVWGVKLAGVLIIYLTVFFAYLILKPYLKKDELYIGLLLSMLFIFRWPIIHYNNLSALFFIVSVWFLIKGLKNSKNYWLYLAGIILGLNIFVRLPNILGFSLILGIFFYGHINNHSFKVQTKQAFWFMFGFITAIVLTLLAMKMMGHYDLYLDSIIGLTELAADESSGHGVIMLSVRLIKRHYETFSNLLISLIIILPLFKVFGRINHKNRILKFLILLICLFLMLIAMRTIYIAVSYLILTAYVFNTEKDKDFRLLSLMSFMIMFLIPLGSNVGFKNANFVMWLAIPIIYHYFRKLNEIDFSTVNKIMPPKLKITFKLGQPETKVLKKSFLGAVIFFSLALAYINIYRDSDNWLKMVHSINHSMLKGVYTTRERAEVVQELLDNLARYVKQDDYLMAYEGTSMIYFLTKTRPYLYNSWPMLYTPPQFKLKLEQAYLERPYLPIIVRAKAKTFNDVWPNVTGLNDSPRYIGNREIMEKFIIKHHYSMVWENRFFQILQPSSFKSQ